MTLTIYNKISIIDLVFFVPALAIAILLTYRHGFRRSSGWIYLVLLSLMRLIGSSMHLATIAQPDNINIIIGAQTLQNVGLSPLILIMLGLLMRVYQSIPEHSRPRIPNGRMLRLIQLLVLVGLILIIVGGTIMGSNIGDALDKGEAFSYTIPAETKAGIALIIVGYVLIIVSAAKIAMSMSVPSGETRILVAVAAAAPLVLVRLVYSSMATLDATNENLRQYSGSADAGYYVLGMCTVMEIASVVIFEAVGLTLPYTPRSERTRVARDSDSSQPLDTHNAQDSAAGETHYFPKDRESV